MGRQFERLYRYLIASQPACIRWEIKEVCRRNWKLVYRVRQVSFDRGRYRVSDVCIRGICQDKGRFVWCCVVLEGSRGLL